MTHLSIGDFHHPVTQNATTRPLPCRLKACCGEKEYDQGAATVVDETAATLKSMYTGDASIEVSLLSPSSGERLGGTWYLSLDGEATEHIDAGADAQEVLSAIQNVTAAGNVSVTENVGGEGYNGEHSWIVTFLDWNDPNRTAVPSVVAVGAEGLTGIGAAAHLETAAGASVTADVDGALALADLCVKAVVKVTSLISSGDIDECVFVAAWQGNTNYAVPAFSFDANAASVETALAGVDQIVLGKVWVSREEGSSASGGGVWDLTFVGNSGGRTPELQCASDADVSQVETPSCEAIGGSFVLAFKDGISEEIAFDATAAQVGVEKSTHISVFLT